MAGPTSPGAEGPTFGPPHLPPGWIAQWDGASKKYYFVQLSTGVSQWDTPTDAAPTGTPAPGVEHPYGIPRQQELITHPDGSQTVRHVDGSMEPVNPPMPPDGTRGIGGQTGDRGLGSMAMNALLGGKDSSNHNTNGNHGGSGSNPFGNLANQFLGGGGHGGGGAGKNALGKLGGALANSFLHSGDKPEQPQSYHSGQTTGHQPQQQQQQQQQQHGLAGSLMGGVASMLGGNKPSHGDVQLTCYLLQSSSYGYSNSGSASGGYSGQAPPTSYQPPGGGANAPGASSYQTTTPNHAPNPSFPSPSGQNGSQASAHQTHPTYGQVPGPPPGKPPGAYGQSSGYDAPSQGGHHHQQQQQQQQQPQYGHTNNGVYEPSYGNGGNAPGAYPGNNPTYSQGPNQQGHGYGSQY
ncbi:hypothetical protein ACHAO3_002095 [Verticillium nonalfalfae]